MDEMFLKTLETRLQDYRPFKDLVARFSSGVFPMEIDGPRGVVLSAVLKRMLHQAPGNLVVVLPTEREVNELERDLSLFLPETVSYPWFGTIPYKSTSHHAHIHGKRMGAYQAVQSDKKKLILTSLRAVITIVPPPVKDISLGVGIKRDQEIDPLVLQDLLVGYGYIRVPQVSVIGEFALRGEVLDIFLPASEEPVRIVFEWDTVEEIKVFSPLTQNTSESLDELILYPVNEFRWDDQRLDALEEKLMGISRKESAKEAAQEYLEMLRAKMESDFDELFYPWSFDEPSSFLDYFDKKSTMVLIDKERLVAGREVLQKEYREMYLEASRKEDFPLPKPEDLLFSLEDLLQKLERQVIFPSIRDTGVPDRIHFTYSGSRSYFGNIVYLKEDLSSLLNSGYIIFIFAESESQAGRIRQLLKDYEVTVIAGSISSGFSLPELKLMVIQENEIFGRKRRIPPSVKKAKSRAIETFVELNPGDFVVHINYGIGRFLCIDRIAAAGTERDYIQLEYAGDEKIFIPIEQVNLIQKYIGQEGRAPRLDKIGGKSWANRKDRVRKSVEDLADMLIKLYSKRKKAQGFAFSDDTDWQIEFEAAFPYEETEDQLKCIQDVKSDMEAPKPMDRLICGDVGYGKTEIAMRAAFKAVVAGKQAAFLAPTTILVEQHYENIMERFDPYPVKTAMISRFVSKKEQKKIVEGISTGDIDLVIGTHRLLQKDVKFKNLGLMILDEEQRFGVKDKERLKNLKANIDSLALSATPIPRTLHMSLLKIRDISLLTTPPHNRLPIETYIREYNEEVVAEAVRREIERGGQVFYLHNRIETLENVQSFITKLVPEVLVEFAHGRMSSSTLEDKMHRFVHGAYQVLVATTIIENGIDIPNVNTIIIDRADMYGVSQLYQLRGRVGRSNRTAYAYLLYPEERALSEIAMKRLQIISDHTELGSGFKIAMKDMEVRGAGNLLGRQQHGEIASVGFDMYLRILDEAIMEMSEDEAEPPIEVFLELEYSGYIPDSYIENPSTKMEIYKSIASVSEDEELLRIHNDLQDKYGPLPDQVSSLMSLAELRIICRKLKISSLRERINRARIEFAKVSHIPVDRVMHLIQTSGGTMTIDQKQPNVMIMKTDVIGLSEKTEYIRQRLSTLV